jgi:hypothetical protein
VLPLTEVREPHVGGMLLERGKEIVNPRALGLRPSGRWEK